MGTSFRTSKQIVNEKELYRILSLYFSFRVTRTIQNEPSVNSNIGTELTHCVTKKLMFVRPVIRKVIYNGGEFSHTKLKPIKGVTRDHAQRVAIKVSHRFAV